MTSGFELAITRATCPSDLDGKEKDAYMLGLGYNGEPEVIENKTEYEIRRILEGAIEIDDLALIREASSVIQTLGASLHYEIGTYASKEAIETFMKFCNCCSKEDVWNIACLAVQADNIDVVTYLFKLNNNIAREYIPEAISSKAHKVTYFFLCNYQYPREHLTELLEICKSSEKMESNSGRVIRKITHLLSGW